MCSYGWQSFDFQSKTRRNVNRRGERYLWRYGYEVCTRDVCMLFARNCETTWAWNVETQSQRDTVIILLKINFEIINAGTKETPREFFIEQSRLMLKREGIVLKKHCGSFNWTHKCTFIKRFIEIASNSTSSWSCFKDAEREIFLFGEFLWQIIVGSAEDENFREREIFETFNDKICNYAKTNEC